MAGRDLEADDEFALAIVRIAAELAIAPMLAVARLDAVCLHAVAGLCGRGRAHRSSRVSRRVRGVRDRPGTRRIRISGRPGTGGRLPEKHPGRDRRLADLREVAI